MKKLIIPLFLCGSIFATGIKAAHAQVLAQATLNDVSVSEPANKTAAEKKVSDSFDQLFKGAVATEWFEVNRNYSVNFVLDNQKSQAEFTREGHLLYLIVYGNEKEMPADLRTTVKSTYFDYTINSTVKITFEGRVFWIVNLEDANQFIVLRVEGDDMDVMKKIKKV